MTWAPIPGRGEYSALACDARREWLTEHAGFAVDGMDEPIRPEQLRNNIENFIGTVQVPVGIAGPLEIHGKHVHEPVVAPFATTEGALVASASRGAKVINLSGGVSTYPLSHRIARAPVFMFDSLHNAVAFANWVRTKTAECSSRVVEVSRYARLESIEPQVNGNAVHVLFVYDTQEAAGQNMVTSATDHVCRWLSKQPEVSSMGLRDHVIEAKMSGDKILAAHSLHLGRGVRVTAECVVSEEALRTHFRVRPKRLLEICNLLVVGSLQAGGVGFAVNVSNVIAAIFAATGQDMACVLESSIGVLRCEEHPTGIYMSLLLNGLTIGTVGGGTHLPAQSHMLRLMKCTGPHSSLRLAEVIAGYCLALELSTIAAGAAGEFVSAHEKLGRNRPGT